ncbi:MAG: glycogen synthase [Flavobacteriaceae bacterium CG_4_10_14_3_um_filter_31_253]|nr:MAG: glycogen synthase [Flavobacteriaceae bacterium CG17_big_fil_post_rev_8_21_14_2_50_31_13]PIX13002.1 MAG: glycogen synthase [Flavobacteriaceae bacterium CG_4_8_14_3_um_filter_31_8]PIY14244.1 MAG: glycogen synthase [Flavobacteriaceae bacterium CG_4_10_14_3_um_filter_31_253]PIZ09206.1 MAG: glycogen synthase [Flavobacteriaceae bacterium CG_4_10_14_0_8_um_filter_31_99]PJC08741.1 MAG: glycogen synthase [Flavobacteriaceae bacterium CG_4_9_14_0_8_um_filter_31_91]
MKTLFFTREFPPYVYGGAGVHVEYLAAELSKLMKIEIRSFGDQDSTDGNLQVKGFPYENPIFDNSDDLLKAVFKTLSTGLHMNADFIDADIVHCHTWYAHFAGIIAKLCYGIPLVITTHSLEPLRPWKREQLGRGYDASSWIEKTAIEMADALIAVSNETKDDILNYFNVDENKIKVIYNGINLQQYITTSDSETLDEYQVDKTKPYVLFVGRITRQKGIIHLVNAIKYIDENTQIVLCAGAPDTKEIGLEMEQAVNEIKKIRKNVIWIDKMLEKKQVIQLYSHAAVFCCPSIYEPFGIINIEAMACNTAVVASAVGGIKEVVVDGETGILVPVEQQNIAPFEPVNPDKFSRDLADGINKLINHPTLRNSMAKNGRKRVEDYFDWISVAKQTEELYKSLKNSNK